jgi:hypothetical protein
MKKVIFLILALSLIFGTVANATLTKTLTMGEANGIIHDDGNIWLYPSTIYIYPNLATGEFDSAGFDFAGLNYSFGQKSPLVMGLYFTTSQPYDLPHRRFDWSFGANPPDNNRIDFFAAYKFGNNPVGLHLNYIGNSTKNEFDSIPAPTNSPPDKSKEGITNIAIKLGMTLLEGNADIVARVNFLSWTDKNALGNDTTQPSGCFGINLAGRYFYQVNSKTTLVPHGAFTYEKIGAEYFDSANIDGSAAGIRTGKDSWSDRIVDLGLGLNYSPAANIEVIGDAGFELYFGDQSWERSAAIFFDSFSISPFYPPDGIADDTVAVFLENNHNYGTTVLPYFKIGMSAKIFDWLDIRMGAISQWNVIVYDSVFANYPDTVTDSMFTFDVDYYNLKSTQKSVTTSLYLGAGFHWNRFKIDCYIDPKLLTDGFDFISGTPGNNEMNYRVSILYEMF